MKRIILIASVIFAFLAVLRPAFQGGIAGTEEVFALEDKEEGIEETGPEKAGSLDSGVLTKPVCLSGFDAGACFASGDEVLPAIPGSWNTFSPFLIVREMVRGRTAKKNWAGFHRIDGVIRYFEKGGREAERLPYMKITAFDYGRNSGALSDCGYFWNGSGSSFQNNWGDCTLLESEGEYLLMDTCIPDSGERILRKLRSRGLRKLSLYVSHYHEDHCGQVCEILKDPFFEVGRVYLRDPYYLEGKEDLYFQGYYRCFTEICRAAASRHVPVEILKEGSCFEIGTVKARVIYMKQETDSEHVQKNDYINNRSLVTMFTCGDVRFLTAGDITSDIEKEILEKGIDIRADLFKMNHHGFSGPLEFDRKVGFSYAWYNAIDPEGIGIKKTVRDAVNNAKKVGNVFGVRTNGDIVFEVKYGRIRVKAEANTRRMVVKARNRNNRKLSPVSLTVNSAPGSHLILRDVMLPFGYDLPGE